MTDPEYRDFQDEELETKTYGTKPGVDPLSQPKVNPKPKVILEEPLKRKLEENERLDVDYDSFDTYLFYSFFVIKKWLLFTLLSPNIQIKNPAEFFQKTKEFVWSKEDNLFKKVLTGVVMIPVFLVLLVYAIMIALIILLVGLVCLMAFVLFVDLPFMIVLAIQLTLLLLLIFYTTLPTVSEMASLFLVSGIWYTELIWMILFVGLMLKEYDDIGNSIIYIATYYRNKKIPSRTLTWFYILFSCFPQFVQFLITSCCAWFSVQLIFKCTSYLSPFSHFSGLFVILQVDSFIMEFIKISKLYAPPGKVFRELETIKAKEREDEGLRIERLEASKQKPEDPKHIPEGPIVVPKIYTWDQVHFTTRTIEKFFGLKNEAEVNFFLYNPKFENEEDERMTGTRLKYLKWGIMTLGMVFILYNFITYVIEVCCCC